MHSDWHFQEKGNLVHVSGEFESSKFKFYCIENKSHTFLKEV